MAHLDMTDAAGMGFDGRGKRQSVVLSLPITKLVKD